MPLKIAISGKGGAGKTTLAAVLSRLYAREGRKVLAVDADPSASLMAAVGIPSEEREKAKPLASMYDLIEEKPGARPGQGHGGMFKLNPKVSALMENYSVEGPDKVEVLLLGTVNAAGEGCFSPESPLLKRVMDHLLLEEDEIVIMDMEEGLEHLGRSTARNVDIMLIVVEPGMRSVDSAATIARRARELGVGNVFVVLNKCSSKNEEALVSKELKKRQLELVATIPNSDVVKGADLLGVSPMDMPGIESLLPVFQSIKDRIDSS